MVHIVLASQSPRRQQLLPQIGITDFTVLVPDVDESYDPAQPPREIVSSISRRKALAARDMLNDPDALVIAADTMVFQGQRRLGKPRDEADAFAMLSALSDADHLVCTGVTLCRRERLLTCCEDTTVHFRPLTDEEIRSYIRSGEPMDKAGAYGAQGKAALFVSHIHGDYFNVMGLPLYRLGQMLQDFGVSLF